MNFVQFITLMLLSLEPSYSDKETWGSRTERMELVAQAIDDASSKATCSDIYAIPSCQKLWSGSKKDLALLLVTKGYWESRFAKNVHEGKCRPYECDAVVVAGQTRSHRARSLWQIQRTSLVNAEEYKLMNSSSLEATKMSANVATRYLSAGFNKCRTIQGAISVYGGAGCNWSGSNARFSFFTRISSKSESILQKEAALRKAALEKRFALEDKTAENKSVKKQ